MACDVATQIRSVAVAGGYGLARGPESRTVVESLVAIDRTLVMLEDIDGQCQRGPQDRSRSVNAMTRYVLIVSSPSLCVFSSSTVLAHEPIP